MLKLQFIGIFILLSNLLFGQEINCLTIHLKRKEVKTTNHRFYINDFYLKRNCIYNFELFNKKEFNARLLNIYPDTLVFTNYFNESVAKGNNDVLDTLYCNISELKSIKVVADKTLGVFRSILLSQYKIEFVTDCNNSIVEIKSIRVYKNDKREYEIFPYLTAQGYYYLYEDMGKTYYYQGQISKKINNNIDNSYRVRNIAWYTPNEVEEINGLAIGFFTDNMKNEFNDANDSLKIRGLNIELMPFGFVWVLSGTIFKNPEESMDSYNRIIKNNYELKIHGINLSLSGTVSKAKICGLNIAGLSTSVGELHGLSISGINTFSFIMNGVNISLIQNIVVKCRGIQIGLFNRAKDLRGVQIGLWNNNGRFSLPFVNARFR